MTPNTTKTARKSHEVYQSLKKQIMLAELPAGQQLVELDRLDEARTFLRDGIDEARRQNNQHAAAEMSELLAEIGK